MLCARLPGGHFVEHYVCVYIFNACGMSDRVSASRSAAFAIEMDFEVERTYLVRKMAIFPLS